jgi:hypothetical protein
MCPSILQDARHAVLLAASMLALPCVAFAQERATVAAIGTLAELEVLALDPENISDRQVKEVLSKVPAPQLMTFKGTLFADMESFGRFLSEMHYPKTSIRPYDVTWHGCTCVECAEIADALFSYYERDGMVPILVGHSGGGVVVSRLLYGLAGSHAVRDPSTPATPRFSELRVPYAAVLATGTLMRKFPGFPGCSEDIERLPKVPDSVAEFTSFQVEGDVFTIGMEPYRPIASAEVRNVALPSATSHISAFRMEGLAQDANTRAWISAYRPDQPDDRSSVPDASNILQAADIWFSIKKHWCTEAQRLIRERSGNLR